MDIITLYEFNILMQQQQAVETWKQFKILDDVPERWIGEAAAIAEKYIDGYIYKAGCCTNNGKKKLLDKVIILIDAYSVSTNSN